VSTKSGTYWVTWANQNALNSTSLDRLETNFKTNVVAFKTALEAAGATVSIQATRRSDKRAYLFHWAWRIFTGDVKADAATAMTGVDIEWDHDDEAKSIAGAEEMVTGFGLAVPPNSTVAPSLTSNHIRGKAIDMTISWTGKIDVAKKDGTCVEIKISRLICFGDKSFDCILQSCRKII